jgi:aspartate aminotransferase-like enzyme
MDRPLREHIRELEDRLQRLNAEGMENRLSRTERNRVEAEIRAVNLALTHFRDALELERQLAGSKE